MLKKQAGNWTESFAANFRCGEVSTEHVCDCLCKSHAVPCSLLTDEAKIVLCWESAFVFLKKEWLYFVSCLWDAQGKKNLLCSRDNFFSPPSSLKTIWNFRRGTNAFLKQTKSLSNKEKEKNVLPTWDWELNRVLPLFPQQMKTETKGELVPEYSGRLWGGKEKQRQVHDRLHPSPAPVNSEKCSNSQPSLSLPPPDLQLLHTLL